MRTSNVELLKAIDLDLRNYASPFQKKGFYREFIDWVYREWSTRYYFRMDHGVSRLELGQIPIRTDYNLKEMMPTYRDFIHALTGRHHYNPAHVNGSESETLEKELYDFFHESMRTRAILFLDEKLTDDDPEDFWDKIFCEEFEGDEEAALAEDLCYHYGFYGAALDSYLCAPFDVETEAPGIFAEWGFRDFEIERLHLDTSPPFVQPLDRLALSRFVT